MAEWVWLGDRAIRFPRPAKSAATIVRECTRWGGVTDVVVTAEDVAVYYGTIGPQLEPTAKIRALAGAEDRIPEARDVELRAIYDGPDLEDVARATGLTVEDVTRRHAAATYTVEMMGFAPGFAYLSGLDPRLELPRRATPRTRVPANSIGIAGKHTTVYPFDSPGGWHLIGHVAGVRMFSSSGALLRLGDRVRFVP